MALLLVSLQKSTDNWEIVFVQSKYLEYVTDNNRSYSRWAGVFGWIPDSSPTTAIHLFVVHTLASDEQ